MFMFETSRTTLMLFKTSFDNMICFTMYVKPHEQEMVQTPLDVIGTNLSLERIKIIKVLNIVVKMPVPSTQQLKFIN